MYARDVMSTPVITISTGATVRDAARLLVNSQVSALPVVDERNALAGIVSEVDLIRRVVGEFNDPTQLHAHLGSPDSQEVLSLTVAEIMTTAVVTATEDTSLDDVATLMLEHQTKRIPIMRGTGVIGVVSRIDLVKAMLSHGAPGAAAATPAPAPAARDDESLRLQVTTAIHRLGIPLGGTFDVVVRHGIAHLWGQVGSVEEDKACQMAAIKMDGVTDAISHMQVMPRR
ncbi:CBS domain-containing protein [Rhodospirillales bacterium URHD0017]|nr:CBS domain-containing protein [Rhodospirillales bacterium URHD0017]